MPAPSLSRRKRVAWTPADDSLLRQLVADGCDRPTIAARMDRPLRSIDPHLRELGLTVDKRRPWTKSELADARKMRAQGLSFEKIARALGRTSGSVQKKFAPPPSESKPQAPERPLLAVPVQTDGWIKPPTLAQLMAGRA